MTDAEFELIQYGMTKSELRAALGAPKRIEDNGSWVYDAINIWEGRVLIIFDTDGRVEHIITQGDMVKLGNCADQWTQLNRLDSMTERMNNDTNGNGVRGQQHACFKPVPEKYVFWCCERQDNNAMNRSRLCPAIGWSREYFTQGTIFYTAPILRWLRQPSARLTWTLSASNARGRQTEIAMTTTVKFNVRAVLIAPLGAFIASLALAFCSGIFLFNVAFAFGVAPDADSIGFTILFLALFVLPAYVLCGYIAARMAGTRPLVHAAIAAAILLLANALMAFPPNPGALSWSDVLCFVSIVPLGLVGGFLATKH